MESNYTLGYWKIRGLGFHIRAVFEYVGVQYAIKDFVQGDGPEFSREQWYIEKPSLAMDFPNLPFLFDGELKISETLAIMRHIANKHDKTLLGKTVKDQATQDMLLLVLHFKKGPITSSCYNSPDKAVAKQIAYDSLPDIVHYLGKKPYLLGDYVTLADLYLLEMIDLIDFISDNEVFT